MNAAPRRTDWQTGDPRPIQRDAAALASRLRLAFRTGTLELPMPGSGATTERHRALHEMGREDLSFARVAEAHVDACSILAEAGCQALPESLYGVWASDGPGSQLLIEATATGGFLLRGLKKYCSGASFLDAALVTAHRDGELLLIAVPLASAGIQVQTTEWASPAFHATATGSVTFDGVAVSSEQIIGGAGWYLTRPGFWHGAVGPAACWAGGAAALVDAARKTGRKDAHFLAHLGALEAAAWGMSAVLERAGRDIDADPRDQTHGARSRALFARHLIERACTDILDRFGRATGPALLAFDAGIAQRYAELTLYIRQCHAERDLQAAVQ